MAVIESITDAPTDQNEERRNRLVIGLLLVSAFVVILNETIMGVALPYLMTALSITAVAAQWLTTAFLLTMAVVIPVTGFLIQRLTTRQVFVAAMSLFSLGTLVAAIAPGFSVLLVARVIQASGTAIMMPLLMTTVMNLVPADRRGATMGNIAIVISVAPAIGPTISGLILSRLSWRFMFVLVLPIAVGALMLGISKIVNVSEPREIPIDVVSVLLSVVGFGPLVYGLSVAGESGGGFRVAALVPLGVGALAMGLFIWRQVVLQRSDRALLDLRTFTNRTFAVSCLMFVVSMMALFGVIILLPLAMQKVLGLGVLASGLLMLPGGLVMGLLGPIVGRLYDRLGPRPLLIPGVTAVSGVLWLLSTFSASTPWWLLLVAHLLMSIGLAFTFTPLFSTSLGALPPRLYAYGSATIGTVQQLAGATGTALFVALMSYISALRLSAGVAATEALAEGLQMSFRVGAVISLFAIALAVLVRRPPLQPQHDGASTHH